jgi:hypothetical protein
LIGLLLGWAGSNGVPFGQEVPPQIGQPPPGGRASIGGELFHPDGRTPLEGARAYAINVKTGAQYISEVTGAGGGYVIRGLPAGTFDIAVEIGGRIFVADNLVDLSAGESLSLSFAIQPQRPANRLLDRMPQPAGSAEPLGWSMGNAGAPGFWRTPGGITLLALLGAGAVVAVVDALDDDDASPSTP